MANAAAHRGKQPSSRTMVPAMLLPLLALLLVALQLPLAASATSTGDSLVIPSIKVSGATNNALLLGNYARTAKRVVSTGSPVWELMGQNVSSGVGGWGGWGGAGLEYASDATISEQRRAEQKRQATPLGFTTLIHSPPQPQPRPI